jgi:hypothetical protein
LTERYPPLGQPEEQSTNSSLSGSDGGEGEEGEDKHGSFSMKEWIMPSTPEEGR